jgi:hypothetical protein
MTAVADGDRIAGHRVRIIDVAAGAERVRLCTVDDLEALVDRGAVLRGGP